MVSVFVNFEALEPINLNQINELPDALIWRQGGSRVIFWRCGIAESRKVSDVAGLADTG